MREKKLPAETHKIVRYNKMLVVLKPLHFDVACYAAIENWSKPACTCDIFTIKI